MYYKLRKLGDNFYVFTVWKINWIDRYKDELLFLYSGGKKNINKQANDLGFYILKEFENENSNL
tara:strand:- start:656 stop:847 length:192 start_codon:yes stop_codon:yes gene_type:complete